MISLDPFKLAGNYSQKSGIPISEVLISKPFGGNPPDPPSSAVPLPAPQLTFSCYDPAQSAIPVIKYNPNYVVF